MQENVIYCPCAGGFRGCRPKPQEYIGKVKDKSGPMLLDVNLILLGKLLISKTSSKEIIKVDIILGPAPQTPVK